MTKKEDTLALDGLHIRYSVEGQGPDLVLVHGWTSSRRMWGQLISKLSDRYRCWALDLPGCGDSDKPPHHWYSIGNYTQAVTAFMQALGLGEAHLAGHSMGGMIALDLAAGARLPLKKLVAINPVVTGRRSSLRPLAHWGPGRRLLDWVLQFSPRMLRPVLGYAGAAPGPGIGHLVRRFEDFSKGTAESILYSGQAVITHDLSPRLTSIRVPTLVIVGEYDLTVSNREGRLAAQQIPGAHLAVLPTGHQSIDDNPAETLSCIQEFLA